MWNDRSKMHAHARGVTLVEVLIVVAILALIAGGVAIVAVPKFIQAQKDTAATDARTLLGIVETWRIGHATVGAECPTIDRLKADGDVKPEHSVRDPWGSPYVIVCEGTSYGVTSAGADARAGTADDVAVGVACAKAKDAGRAELIGCR